MRRKDREIVEKDKLVEVLEMCKTASVAMIDEGVPYVVPLSYGYEMQEDKTLVLYFHCAKEGRKLDILHKNSKVCFTIFSEGEPLHAEVPCNSGYYYASIIGNGDVEFIEETSKKCYALGKMFERQAGRWVDFTKEQADAVCVFQIVSKEFTGKQKAKG